MTNRLKVLNMHFYCVRLHTGSEFIHPYSQILVRQRPVNTTFSIVYSQISGTFRPLIVNTLLPVQSNLVSMHHNLVFVIKR